MTARILLDRLAELGISVTAEAGDLVVDGPAAELTPALVAVIRGRKAELLDLLRPESRTVALNEPEPPWVSWGRSLSSSDWDRTRGRVEQLRQHHDDPASADALELGWAQAHREATTTRTAAAAA